MTNAPETSAPEASKPASSLVSAPAALLAAFFVIAVVTTIVDAWLLPSSLGRRGLRALHFTLASLQLLGCGAVLAALVAGWQKAREKRAIPAFPFVLALALAASLATLPDDLGGLADRMSAAYSEHVLLGIIAAVALVEAVFVALLGWAGRSRRAWTQRWPAAILGLALGVANPLALPHDYPGVHLGAALIAGVALAHAIHGREARFGRRALTSRAALVAVGVLSVATILAPLPNSVRADMLRATGAVVAPFSSRLTRSARRAAKIPPDLAPWCAARAGAPIAPRGSRVLPRDGVVVLLTVDALRADVVMSGKHDRELPTFKALREEGVRFTAARAPGAQTVPVVTGLFTGKYYTQIYWSGGTAKHAWSAADTSVRFPELLQEAGVVTVTLPTLREVQPANGTLRGFDEEKVQWRRWPGEPSPLASTIANRVTRRLRQAEREGEPLFLYVHFADAHAPYTRGGKDCAPFDCYLREVAIVDQAIGEIRAALSTPSFASRSVLIVSADHGEAFGEHGQRYHATTLYEELLRVPLLVTGPGFPAHAVDTPVSLLDLGPTILELYGLATPSASMGESLVRLLENKPDRLTRPIAADSGRLMQAMIFPDNVKVIRNVRNHTAELYDLTRDPGEEHDLFDSAPDAEDRLAIVEALFEANAFKKPGYAPPYRK